MSLIARVLEANGIATIVIGSALDIVLHCGIPRYVHSDLPLGNPCGAPFDTAMQQSIMSTAISLLADARGPNAVLRSDAAWPGDDAWRDDYSRVDDSNRELLKLKGEARRRQQTEHKAHGNARAALIADS